MTERNLALNDSGNHRYGAIQHFLDEGLIADVVRIVKTGKEASVRR